MPYFTLTIGLAYIGIYARIQVMSDYAAHHNRSYQNFRTGKLTFGLTLNLDEYGKETKTLHNFGLFIQNKIITNHMNTTKTQVMQALAELGITLPLAPKPGGSYVSVNIRGSIAYVAIQFPIQGDNYLYTGKLGKDLSIQEGYDAARLCALNTLAQIDNYVGFEKILGLNHLDIYYQAFDGWDEGPLVANGASELFIHALGPLGIHTRAIMGVHALPRNFSVGITASFTLLR